jgi:hypothetical protein
MAGQAPSEPLGILRRMTDEKSDALKKLLRDPLGDIRLEDLLVRESASAAEQLVDERFGTRVDDLSFGGFGPVWIKQVRDYETLVTPLLEPARLIGSYGLTSHAQAWKKLLTPFSRWAAWTEGVPALVQLRGYPALVLLYTVALASVLRDNYGPLLGVATLPRVRIRPGYSGRNSDPLVAALSVSSVVADGLGPIASALALSDDGAEITEELIERLRRGGRYTPMSDHLHALLRPIFVSEVDRDDEWDDVFDRTEVVLDALAIDAAAQDRTSRYPNAGGFGRYASRYKYVDEPIEKQVLAELESDGEGWPPVAAGLFGRVPARGVAALSSVVETAAQIRAGRN